MPISPPTSPSASSSHPSQARKSAILEAFESLVAVDIVPEETNALLTELASAQTASDSLFWRIVPVDAVTIRNVLLQTLNWVS